MRETSKEGSRIGRREWRIRIHQRSNPNVSVRFATNNGIRTDATQKWKSLNVRKTGRHRPQPTGTRSNRFGAVIAFRLSGSNDLGGRPHLPTTPGRYGAPEPSIADVDHPPRRQRSFNWKNSNRCLGGESSSAPSSVLPQRRYTRIYLRRCRELH